MHPCPVEPVDTEARVEAHKQQQREKQPQEEQQHRGKSRRRHGGGAGSRGAGKPKAHESCGSRAHATGTPTAATQRDVGTTHTRAGSTVEGSEGGSAGGVGSASGLASAADLPSCCLVVEPLPLPVWDVAWGCVLGCLLVPFRAGGVGRGGLLLRGQESGPAAARGWVVGGDPLGDAAASGVRWLGLLLRGWVAMAPFVGVWEVCAGDC